MSRSVANPARHIIDGIDKFVTAVDSRITNGGWNDEHIDELVLIVRDLTHMRYKLLRLAEETS